MQYANGRLPDSILAPIPGGRLVKDAAAAYNAMDAASRRAGGIGLHVTDSYRILGAPGDYARGRWSQWNAWERHKYHGGALAAYPGSSNHGWGLAVDVPWPVRNVITNIGAHYGWSKKWSDAKSEWWHFKYQPGVWNGVVPDVPNHGQIAVVQQLLRGHGYHSVAIDGRIGPAMASALRRFQRGHRLHVNGQPDRATVAALRKSPVRVVRPHRAAAPAAAPVRLNPLPSQPAAQDTDPTRSTEMPDSSPTRFPANRVVAGFGPLISIASAAGAAWLSTHFPGLNVPSDDTAQAITQASSFVIGGLIPWALQHKWLEGYQRWENGQQQIQLASINASASTPASDAWIPALGSPQGNGMSDPFEFNQPDPWAQAAGSPFDVGPGNPSDG
jgi:hypothetical protein